MITDAALAVFSGLASFLLGLLPSMTVPTWATDAATTVANALSNLGIFGWFIPLNAIGNCCVFLLAVTAFVLAVRLGRLAMSLLTGGGGNVSS